MIRGQSQ